MGPLHISSNWMYNYVDDNREFAYLLRTEIRVDYIQQVSHLNVMFFWQMNLNNLMLL